MLIPGQMREKGMVPADLSGYTTGLFNGFRQHRQVIRQPFSSGVPKYSDGILSSDGNHLPGVTRLSAYSARTAHPFQRNGAPFRFKLSKAQQVD